MTEYLVIFAAGMAGSFHCIGMCGGFACALGRDPRGTAATAERQLLYNVGRVTTYCFLGAVAGALGLAISGGSFDAAQRVLAIVAGLLMIVVALQFFGLLQRLHTLTSGFNATRLAASLRNLLASKSRLTPVALGVFNGFLPCPLVYAFAAKAASTAGPLPGFLVMLAFGLGTFPAMLMMGSLGFMLSPVWRQRGVWVAASFLLVLGLITLGRGVLPMDAHIGHAHIGHAPATGPGG